MDCGCKGGRPGKYVDVSCTKVRPWKDVPVILGVTECGNPVPVDKPEFELTEDDRAKLDAIEINGPADEALFADGQYREVYTKTEVDSAVSDAVEDVVMYGADNDVRVRRNLVIQNNRDIIGEATDGNKYLLLGIDNTDTANVGNLITQTNILSFSRPTVTTRSGASTAVNSVAYLSDIDALRNDLSNIIENEIEPLTLRVSNLEARVTDAEENIATVAQSISDLQTSTEAAFDNVSDELQSLGNRVSTNETNIATNTSDIASLREDIAAQERLRGYFETTTAIIAIPNPSLGDYAYNAETGTIWAYNGTTWYDTTTPIPEGAIQAYDGLPLTDGEADPGASNRYARGDHRHPTDETRAAASDLDNYLPLIGNTQTTRMTGDIWLESGQMVRVTNSGNSGLRRSATSTAVELVGAGVEGINLIAENGPVQANGEDVVTYDSNDDIRARRDIYLGNDNNLFGIGADGAVHNLIEKSRFGIIDAGSQAAPFNISSSIRPTVQLASETGSQAHTIAFVDDVNTLSAEVQSDIDALSSRITSNTSNITLNRSDIDSILSRLADEEAFRGYKLTTNDVTATPNPQNGNYVYNVQTGTIWIYNGTTWADSLELIPDGAIQAYNGLPLMDGGAESGASQLYARGDHVHPSDSSKANALDLVSTDNRLAQLQSDFTSYSENNDSDIATLKSDVAANTGSINLVTARVSTIEQDVSTLQTQATNIGNDVNDLTTRVSDAEGRIGTNELDIETLYQRLNDNENFKGYFLTNAELTQTPGTQGDFAWSAESGTIWIYDQTIPSWTDSGNPIPAEAIILSSNLPRVNGAATPGEGTEVSRWDHVHPSDPTKADITAIPTAVSQLTNDSGYTTQTYVADTFVSITTYNELVSRVAALEAILSGVTGFWSGTEAEYNVIATKDPNTYYHTYE